MKALGPLLAPVLLEQSESSSGKPMTRFPAADLVAPMRPFLCRRCGQYPAAFPHGSWQPCS